MTTPAPSRRRMPLALRITLAVVAAIAVTVVGVVLLVTAGIITFAATGPRDDQARDAEHVRQDPAGAYACDELDGWLAVGIGTWEGARDKATTSRTPAIRDATTANAMYAACEAAGSNMSPRR